MSKTYPVTATQLQDITDIALSLNASEKAGELRGSEFQWGQGFHAMLQSPIPVITDAHGVTEPLGWLVFSETGWSFTQTDPSPAIGGLSSPTVGLAE